MLTIKAGDLDLKIPKLRTGSFPVAAGAAPADRPRYRSCRYPWP
ncbi:hypothetical protein AB5J72_48485 [Streptomyces sp. CG1]